MKTNGSFVTIRTEGFFPVFTYMDRALYDCVVLEMCGALYESIGLSTRIVFSTTKVSMPTSIHTHLGSPSLDSQLQL